MLADLMVLSSEDEKELEILKSGLAGAMDVVEMTFRNMRNDGSRATFQDIMVYLEKCHPDNSKLRDLDRMEITYFAKKYFPQGPVDGGYEDDLP